MSQWPEWVSDDGRIRLINADCADVLPTLTLGEFDACLTDPPYGVDYADWDGDIPPQAILSECLRVSSGPVVWFGATTLALEFSRYEPRPDRMLVWSPSFSLSQTGKNGMHYRCHPIWCWRLPKSQDVFQKDLLTHNCEGKHWWDHPATKPLRLMIDLVKAFGGESVIEPYAGSGTTAVACIRMGVRCVAIEEDADHYETCKQRCLEEYSRTALFDHAEARS